MNSGPLLNGGFVEGAALIVGFLAGAIAVGGFLGRADAVLSDRGKRAVERGTIVGGLAGFAAAFFALALDGAA